MELGFVAGRIQVHIRTLMARGFAVVLIRELTKTQMALGSVAGHIQVPTKTPMASGCVVASIPVHIKTQTVLGLSVVHIRERIKIQMANGYVPSRCKFSSSGSSVNFAGRPPLNQHVLCPFALTATGGFWPIAAKRQMTETISPERISPRLRLYGQPSSNVVTPNIRSDAVSGR